MCSDEWHSPLDLPTCWPPLMIEMLNQKRNFPFLGPGLNRCQKKTKKTLLYNLLGSHTLSFFLSARVLAWKDARIGGALNCELHSSQMTNKVLSLDLWLIENGIFYNSYMSQSPAWIFGPIFPILSVWLIRERLDIRSWLVHEGTEQVGRESDARGSLKYFNMPKNLVQSVLFDWINTQTYKNLDVVHVYLIKSRTKTFIFSSTIWLFDQLWWFDRLDILIQASCLLKHIDTPPKGLFNLFDQDNI